MQYSWKMRLSDILISCIFIMLVVLKVAGYITWSWYIILAPIVLYVIFVCVTMFFVIRNFIKKQS